MKHAIALAIAGLLVACGGGITDEVIGDPCTSSADCAESCAIDSSKYPGGFCTLRCRSDADCPSDTACIDKEGGICLFTCGLHGDFDCTFLGPGWRCNDKDNRAGQEIFVCIGD